MELKDFISKTLTEILQGVKDAQEEASKIGAHINPKGLQIINRAPGASQFTNSSQTRYSQLVEFDVALTVTDTSKGKGSIGVFLGGVGLGGQSEKENANSSVSRIKFTVPIFLPEHS